MRTRFNPKAIEQMNEFDRYIKDRETIQKIISENKGKKIYLEIGMGKGDFITQLSLLDQDNVYIGVELSPPVLALAVKKLQRYEEENNVRINNLYFMSFDAIEIAQIFEENQIEKIYLNFSDPWPKKKHAKRRLTNEKFLDEYKKVLRTNGQIEFKTDNRGLFEYSLVSMQNYGLKFIEVYLDLHKTDIFNIETEYEKKFSPLGPIYKIVVEY
ncbi:MAG: tRNA (guanosine(46)-N7)-methyltransferase TrmB [Clostridia bacterium]|nr:tRNA (guanosine(46)-N7)-methyltransferase TrmB [Clostridia bacterium]